MKNKFRIIKITTNSPMWFDNCFKVQRKRFFNLLWVDVMNIGWPWDGSVRIFFDIEAAKNYIELAKTPKRGKQETVIMEL